MKIIAFSIWGAELKFVFGAIRNIILAERYYPDWKCRIYCGTDVPMEHREELYDAGFQVNMRSTKRGIHDGLFWRFEPAYEEGVEAFISRDCDSRLNPREAAAVAAWLKSGKLLHTMRDHYEHIVPILGGMWGCRHWPEFGHLLADWKKIGKMGDDQEFLKEKVWPLVRENNSIAHDRYSVDTTVDTPSGPFTYKPIEFFGKHNLQAFPPHEPMDTIIHGSFVGARL